MCVCVGGGGGGRGRINQNSPCYDSSVLTAKLDTQEVHLLFVSRNITTDFLPSCDKSDSQLIIMYCELCFVIVMEECWLHG